MDQETAAAKTRRRIRQPRVAEAGEGFRSYFDSDALCARLTALGFCEIEDLGLAAIAARYFARGASSASDKGGHILRASTIGGAAAR